MNGNQMDELTSKRPPSPSLICQSCEPQEQAETKDLIRSKLKVLMSQLDLDEVTSKFVSQIIRLVSICEHE